MKKLKQIFNEVKAGSSITQAGLNQLLWQLICYSPKMPIRLQQQQLLDEATKFSLNVKDEYFAHKDLNFNGFKWRSGRHRVLITHGWGSKAADFTELITSLREIDDLEIIAFDAPGNGGSEGELSNLLLYIEAVNAIILEFGSPDILIGHSLGGMANIIAIKNTGIKPSLMISLTPLIRLKENFEASMSAAAVSRQSQDEFLKSFEMHFGVQADHYNLHDLYAFDGKHWLAYDKQDIVSPYRFIEEFLIANPLVESNNYDGTGHDKIIKSPEVIRDVINRVKGSIQIGMNGQIVKKNGF